jgi:threonine/homoserine/homoserine lactone efflux protein
MEEGFLSFVAVAALVIVTPGQDTALTIRNTLAGGRRAGTATAAGVSTGQAAWALATAVGVAAVLRASEPAFLALRLVGAAYLVLLGVRALYGALRGRLPDRAAWARSPARGHAPRVAFRQGLLSNLGNPKMAVFFTSLLPQFAAPGQSSFAPLLLLGLIFALLTLVWLCAYAAAVARASHVLGRPTIRRAVEALTGAALVALGVRVATEAR